MTGLAEGAALLGALQLGDSFFPSGLYTQSHGLERLIEGGLKGEAALEPLLHSYLRAAAGPGDVLAARLVAQASLAGDAALVAAVDERLEATKLSLEGREASRRCGGRIVELASGLFGGAALHTHAVRVAQGCAPGHQAVAMALAGAASGLDENAVALVEAHTFAVSLISAAVRLGSIDHIAAQRLLLRARPVMLAAVAEGAGRGVEDLGGFAPAIELAQFQHRYAVMHMFVS